MSDTLLNQLISRTKTFKEKTGLTFKQIGRLTGLSEQHVCDLLAGRKGLNAEATLQLWKLTKASKAEVQMKLSTKNVPHIEHYQANGQAQPMRFDGSGWVAGLGPDPNDGNITDVNQNPARSVPDAAELEFLAGLAGLHQQIIDKISNWQQAQQKARPNPNGSTGPTRQISRPKTAGPRGDLL
jgi:plasmid maintenance system antidote protein VapI